MLNSSSSQKCILKPYSLLYAQVDFISESFCFVREEDEEAGGRAGEGGPITFPVHVNFDPTVRKCLPAEGNAKAFEDRLCLSADADLVKLSTFVPHVMCSLIIYISLFSS